MSVIRPAAFLVLAAGLASPAAALTTYTDRATFESAAVTTVVDDFQSLGASGAFPTAGANLSYGANDPESSWYLASAGQSGNPTAALGFTWTLADYFIVELGGFHRAFGVDVFQNLGGGTGAGADGIIYVLGFYNTALSDSVGEVYGYAQPAGGFLGATATTSFDRVGIYAYSTSDGETFSAEAYEVIDNVSLDAAVSDVPLPAALPLAVAGLAALGVVGKRRRAA